VSDNDADVQTAQQAPHGKARVPYPHGRPLGSRRSGPPPQEGAEAPDGLHRLEARAHLTGDERFPRSRRLVRSEDVRRVIRRGHRSRRHAVDIHWAASESGHPRLGLVTPKFRQTAVARNRVRRWLKDLWRRELQLRLPALDVVIRARPEVYAASYQSLRDELLAWCAEAAP
jgi:ribonuclease P protein component